MSDAHETDGKLKIVITENKESSTGVNRKAAAITPPGFWGKTVTVTAHERYDAAADIICDVYEIGWSCGGADGTLGNPDMVRGLISGLEKALELQAAWQREADSRKRTA